MTINNLPISNVTAVLWSPHQKQFHIEPFDKMLRTNLEIYSENGLGDYTLLGIATSREEARDLIKSITDKFGDFTGQLN